MNKIFKSKKVLLLIIILTISSFFIVSFTVLMLYNTSMDMKENSLIDVVEGQKAIINTLLDYSFGEDEIISVLQKSLGRYQSIGKTGELVVAKKSGDSIIFIYRQKFSGKDSYQPVLLDSNISSPMRKALKGKSGLIRGLDYKGVEVIAGYTYIKKLNWGIVAKINISEVNKPFYKVAIIAAILAFLLVTFGTYFIIKSTNPMMNRIIQSEQKFKSLFDNSADAIFILDIEGKILEANNTACKRLGYEHDELINLSTRNINSEEYAKTLSNRIKLITENASLFCETEHVGKDGTIFPIELNASLIDFNNQKAILSIARDITERKLAEARLKENELLLRTIAENYPNSYLSIIEKDYTIGFTSGQELKKLNLAPETFVGLNLEEVFGEHSPTVKKYYEKTFEGEEIKFELFFNNQNQLYRTVPLRNEKGEIERILSVVENITERKREEEKNKLKAQEQEWLLNSMMNAFVIFQSVFDENGKFISYRFEYINKAYEDITGVKLEEVVGRTVHEVWPKTEQSWIENYGAVAVTGIERTFDMFHAPTDKLYHCNVYRPWKTSERFCVIFEDITERKQAEQALKENEEKFRTLFDLSPFGIILHKDGIVLSANQAAAKIFGAKSPGELVGYELLKLVDEEYHEIIKKRMDEIIRTNIEAPLLEEKLRRLDGTVFDAECVARQITIEGQSFIQVMFNDITERKQSEMALKESEEKLKAIYDGSNDAIMLLNEKGFFDCNPKTLEMFGFNSKEDFTKIHPAEVSPLTQPDGRDSMEAAGEKIRIAYEQGFNRFEWVHRKSTGEDFPAEVLLSAFDFGGEKVLQATVRDITERKRAEQLIQARMKMLDYAATHTLDELLQKALDIVCELTDSPIGFYHFVNEDQKTLHLAAWSTRTVKEFCTAEGRGTHYSIDKAGVWVDCILERRPVIHNDYASLPHRKGLPEGHAPVIRELVVPIIRNELTVAVLGIGNRQIDYTEQDIQVVSYLADVAWEITVRKRAEEALRASQERLSTITNSAMDGIVMMNNEGNISFWNPAAKEIFGYTREEALGKNLHKLIAPESYHPSHLEAFPIWQQSGEGNAVGKTLELSALRKNGEEFPVELSLSSVKQHDSWLAVGIIRDITERKKAERTISDQNKFLLNVIESLKYPFYVVNAEDYSIVLANSTSLEGKSKEREAYCYSLIHNFDNSCGSDVHTCPLTEIKMTMKPVILEDIHIDKNGNEINVEVHGYPITNDDGELIQIIEYVIDITERKKTERLIRERTIELENIIKNRDQMFKIIAHDLRSPFNGLLGFSNILVDEFDTLPKEEIQEYTIMNHTLIKNIYNLLENLLSWVLIQQDRIVIKKADVNINMALTKLIDVYKGNTDKKNITVDLKISDNINIFTDSNLLFTVFRNLISNAIKFTPDNGKITVSAKEENSQVFFSVSDTGVGIPENLKEKIMQPGELFSTQGTASEKGSGLGLMLCKEYIEKLGGRIWFESEEGKGTTFYFSLPIS